MATPKLGIKETTVRVCNLVSSLYKKNDGGQAPRLPILEDVEAAAALTGKAASTFGAADVKVVADIVGAAAACAQALIPNRVARWNRWLNSKPSHMQWMKAQNKPAEYMLEDNTMQIAGFNRDLPIVHNGFMFFASGMRHLYPDDATHKQPNQPRNKHDQTRQLQPSKDDQWLLPDDCTLDRLRDDRWALAGILAIIASMDDAALDEYAKSALDIAEDAAEAAKE